MVCTLLPDKKSYGAFKIFTLCFFILKEMCGVSSTVNPLIVFKNYIIKGGFFPSSLNADKCTLVQ